MNFLQRALAELNDEQRAAATHFESPLVISAGAGAGKTKTLVARIAYIVSPMADGGMGADPDSVCVLTFTNKSAREMTERLQPLFDDLKDRGLLPGQADKRFGEAPIWAGTFHSISMRILRQVAHRAGLKSNFTIAGDEDAKTYLIEAVKRALQTANPTDVAAAAVEAGAGRDLHRAMGGDNRRVPTPEEFLQKLGADRLAEISLPWLTKAAGASIEAAKNQMLDAASLRAELERIARADAARRIPLSEALHQDFFQKTQQLKEGNETFRIRAANPFALDVFSRYDEAMRAANSVDFADLINHVSRIFENEESAVTATEWRARFRHFLVDEAQDMNPAQMRWLSALSGGGARWSGDCPEIYRERVDYFPWPSIAAAGDEDQAIYGFRGSDVRSMTDFSDWFSEAKTLAIETNYRCQPQVLEIANASISKSTTQGRTQKILRPAPTNPPAAPVVMHAGERGTSLSAIVEEIRTRRDAAPTDSIAILTRTRRLASEMADLLTQAQIPVDVKGSAAWREKKEIRDAVAYATLAINPDADHAFRRIRNSPPRDIGKTTTDRIAQWARENELSEIEASRLVARSVNPLLGGPIDARAMGEMPVKDRAADAMARFFEMFDAAAARAKSCEGTAARALEILLVESGYLARANDDAESAVLIRTLLKEAERFANLDEFCASFSLDPAEAEEEDASLSRVEVMTIHAAKGLEFDHVFVPDAIDGVMPYRREKNVALAPEEMEEERRLFFVAVTRAKKTLSFAAPETKALIDQAGEPLVDRREKPRCFEMKSSRFIDEVKAKLVRVGLPLAAASAPSRAAAVAVEDHRAQDRGIAAFAAHIAQSKAAAAGKPATPTPVSPAAGNDETGRPQPQNRSAEHMAFIETQMATAREALIFGDDPRQAIVDATVGRFGVEGAAKFADAIVKRVLEQEAVFAERRPEPSMDIPF